MKLIYKWIILIIFSIVFNLLLDQTSWMTVGIHWNVVSAWCIAMWAGAFWSSDLLENK